MVIIKKHSEGSFVITTEHLGKIYCDAMTTEAGVHIVTEPRQAINVDKVFNLPGEYECGGVLIRGWPNQPYTFTLSFEGLTCGYFVGPVTEAVIRDIAVSQGQVEIACLKAVPARTIETLKQELKPIVWCTLAERVKIGELKSEQVKEIKLTSKKLSPAVYSLQ